MSLARFFSAIKVGSGATITKIDAGSVNTNSDVRVPTQKAVKTYVDTAVAGGLTGPKGVISIPISFETGEQGDPKIYFPMKVTINKIRGVATKAIAGTDNGTIQGANSTGNSSGGLITCTASDALNTAYSVTPTTNNVVDADGYYQLTAAKTTAGGIVLVTLEYTLTA